MKRGILNFIKFIIYLSVFLFFIGVAVLFSGYLVLSSKIPEIKIETIDSILQETSSIYDNKGNLTENIKTNIHRTIVPIEDIPMYLQEAFIAIEDERFYQHGGIDFKRLVGALVHDIKAKSLEQGASTITMQLSKNLFTSSEKTALRKAKDMIYASQIEKDLSKTDILYAYLNTVYLGSNVNGVEAASKEYFNKDVQNLDLAECAMIAGITKYPSRYIPYTLQEINLDDNFQNMNIKIYPPEKNYTPSQKDLEVYEKLRNNGNIDNYEYILLKKGTLVAYKAVLNEKSVLRKNTVLKKMKELGFISDEAYNKALTEEIILNFPKRNNEGLSTYFNDRVKKETIKILISLGHTKEEAQDLLKFGGLQIYTTLDQDIQRILEEEFTNPSNFPNSYYDSDGLIQPQAAMVFMDQKTGYVKALMGGRGQAGSYLYDRTDNPRQPGSAIKPLAIYLLALKDGKTPYTIINDTPREDPTMPGGYWPRNIFNQYFGNQTMKYLLSVSSNVTAVRTLESLGSTRQKAINRSLDYLTKMGFSHIVRSSDDRVHNDENLAIALGGFTKGVTPLEMAAAFAGIANKGEEISPIFITKILDSDGNEVYQEKQSTFQMIDEINAYNMVDMLKGVIQIGSGKAATLNNMACAGKTGTTDDRKDVYFVGFTPYYTASCWIGSDIPKSLNYTSSVPAILWKKVMDKVDRKLNLPYADFERPSKMPQPEEPEKKETTNIDDEIFNTQEPENETSLEEDIIQPEIINSKSPKEDNPPQEPEPSEPSNSNNQDLNVDNNENVIFDDHYQDTNN